jgi:hypothetical protein
VSDPKTFIIWPQVEGMDALVELEFYLHWPWNLAANDLWEQRDLELCQFTQTPPLALVL